MLSCVTVSEDRAWQNVLQIGEGESVEYSRCVLRQRAANQRTNNTTELRDTLTNSDQDRALHKGC